MKIIIVSYPDSADISTIAIDAAAKVVAGAITVDGGKVVFAGAVSNPPAPTLVQHSHPVTGATGPAA